LRQIGGEFPIPHSLLVGIKEPMKFSQHDAAAEDRGYGKVQQARDESRWK
jgi:hypothetical protein